MKKILTLLLIILLTAGTFTACGSKSADNKADGGTKRADTKDKSSKNSNEDTSVVYPIKVKDANNYEMTIAEKPEKIVSLTLGTDEMLLSLVDPVRILSLTKFVDDPGISNAVDKAKAVKLRTESNAEQVISIGPDLVFVDTWATPEFVKQVRDAGINVYQFKTPSGVDEQREVIPELANVVGEKQKGDELAAWMDKKLKAVEDRLKNLKPENRLSVLSYDELGCTSGQGTNFDSIAQKAGLINLASKEGMKLWPKLSREEMVKLNPDLMVLPSWFYDTTRTVKTFTDGIRNDPSLASVKAVKNNRLLILPNPHMSAISQYVVLGVEDLAKAAYPDLFK